jgi:hypothetical protein
MAYVRKGKKAKKHNISITRIREINVKIDKELCLLLEKQTRLSDTTKKQLIRSLKRKGNENWIILSLQYRFLIYAHYSLVILICNSRFLLF